MLKNHSQNVVKLGDKRDWIERKQQLEKSNSKNMKRRTVGTIFENWCEVARRQFEMIS